MKEIMEKISQRILENKQLIAEQIDDASNSQLHSDLKSRIALVQLYAACLQLPEEEREGRISTWGKIDDYHHAVNNTRLEDLLTDVPLYRQYIGEYIKITAIENQLGVKEFYELLTLFDQIINKVVLRFCQSYLNYHIKQMAVSRQEMLELSAPVVQIKSGVAVLPVIGMIDTERTKHLMEQALTESVKLRLEYFVLDLSGVPVVDTFVAQQLFQIIDALNLIGVKAKISGITPDIAQTVVNLGIDFGNVKTYSSLHTALKMIDSEN